MSNSDANAEGRSVSPTAAERAARQCEARLQALADSLPMPIAYLDRSGRYRFGNSAYCRWFGMPVDELVRKSLSLTRGKARQAGVTVRVDVVVGPRRVFGDAVQLEQVLVNLITNALAAMSSTSADRRKVLTLASLSPDPEQIEIVVRDTGEGIAPDRLARMFDAFYTTKPEGMGVGLAISRSIVEAHEGRLWVESSPGRGTSVFLRLPAAGG